MEEFLRAKDVTSAPTVLNYAAQQIGCPKPVGNKSRGMLYRRIKDELEAQRWTYRHLTSAVDFMKSRGIRARSFDFVFYHVEPAIKSGFMPRPASNSLEGLKEAVTRAVYVETDEAWTRRLLLARGSDLPKVYRLWEQERKPLLEEDA